MDWFAKLRNSLELKQCFKVLIKGLNILLNHFFVLHYNPRAWPETCFKSIYLSHTFVTKHNHL